MSCGCYNATHDPGDDRCEDGHKLIDFNTVPIYMEVKKVPSPPKTLIDAGMEPPCEAAIQRLEDQ